jgi:hypothetical protein
MCVTTRATCWTSNVGSCASVPAGCSALIRGVSVSTLVEPRESESESAVAAFPVPRVSACGGEEDGRRGTDVDLRARDVVRAALERGCAREAGDRVLGRRVRHPVRARDVRGQRAVVDDPPCATPVSPRALTHTPQQAAPPGGDCALNARMAARVKRKEPVRFVSITVRKDSSVVSSIGTCGADTPAFYAPRQPLHLPRIGGAR